MGGHADPDAVFAGQSGHVVPAMLWLLAPSQNPALSGHHSNGFLFYVTPDGQCTCTVPTRFQ